MATRLLIEIWARHNGLNNGQIPFSKREALAALRVGTRKVRDAFQELEDKGFLICRSKGSFDYKVSAGEGRASEWEITEEPCDGKPAKKKYKEWVKKQIPGTAVVPTGNHTSPRSQKHSNPNPPNGDHTSTRYGGFSPPSGDHCSPTYNIPEGKVLSFEPFEKLAKRGERIQPYLDAMKED